MTLPNTRRGRQRRELLRPIEPSSALDAAAAQLMQDYLEGKWSELKTRPTAEVRVALLDELLIRCPG